MEIFAMLVGFNICYNKEIYTTTLFARWVCNLGVKEGRFIKLDKNHYKQLY